MTNFVQDIKQILEREFSTPPKSKEEAQKLIGKVIKEITLQYGGQPVYITKREDKAFRNREIYNRFNGKNTHQICREFNLCSQQVRKIVKRQQKENQHDVFGQ